MNDIYRGTIIIVLSVSFVAFVVPECYDLRTLPIERGTMLEKWSFHNEKPQSLSGCYKLCSRYTACRSVNYMRDSLMCQLNLKRKDDIPADVISKDNTYYIDKGDLDQVFPSSCTTADCKWSEQCVESKRGGTQCVNHTECIYNTMTSSVLQLTSGFIQSVNYPLSYPTHSEQEFVILGPVRSYIMLTFVAFETEECCDHLEVRVGCNSLSPLLLKISGSSHPGQLTILHNRAWIYFDADYSVEKSGFKIHYTIN